MVFCCFGSIISFGWFDTYEMSYREQKNWVFAHIHEYGNAGILAQALEMIPFLNWGFCWTNAIGSALMVVDWERRGERPSSYGRLSQSTTLAIQEEQQVLFDPSLDSPDDVPPPPYESIFT